MPTPMTSRVSTIILTSTGLGPETRITADTPLFADGLALDSVAVLDILLLLEKEFGVELDAQELLAANAMRTVSTLADFIAAKTAGPAA